MRIYLDSNSPRGPYLNLTSLLYPYKFYSITQLYIYAFERMLKHLKSLLFFCCCCCQHPLVMLPIETNIINSVISRWRCIYDSMSILKKSQAKECRSEMYKSTHCFLLFYLSTKPYINLKFGR